MKINKIIALLFPSRRGNQLNGNKFNLFEKTIGDQVPLSQGKPIEWKRIKEQRGARESRVPLSQGKPIEWKPIKF